MVMTWRCPPPLPRLPEGVQQQLKAAPGPRVPAAALLLRLLPQQRRAVRRGVIFMNRLAEAGLVLFNTCPLLPYKLLQPSPPGNCRAPPPRTAPDCVNTTRAHLPLYCNRTACKWQRPHW